MKSSGFLQSNSTLKSYSSLSSNKAFRYKKDEDLAQADSKFSIIIRQRDGKCLRCGTTYLLTCSHFYKRSIYVLRFDPENCVTFCLHCHDEWESKKDGEYKVFMMALLGLHRYQLLEERSKIRMSVDEAVKQAQPYLNKHYQPSEIQY